MKIKSFIAALAALGIAVSAAHAGSTVNPNIPALRNPLNSPPIQQNFQATFNDINNILGKFASNIPPVNPTAFQEWANTTTSPVVVFNYWNAGTATWIPFATLNTATGVYSSFSTTAGFLRTAPITVTVSGGTVTYGLATDGNFATVGGQLAFANIANGSLLARCTGSAGEPTACTWPNFAAQAIGATNGIFPHFVGGAWTTDTTGTSGHAVPFLDGTNTFAAPQTIYPGTATLRAPLTGTLFRVAQLDGTASVIQQDSFGAAAAFSCMRADGTAAISTALAANDLICAFGSHGYDGVANSTVAGAFRLYASQGWTSAAHGTYARVATTANGTTTPVEQFSVENDGGITAPPTVTGGSKGAGTVNVSGGYDINGAPFGVSNLAGTGTGVQTALGINTGTAGGFVVNGGALGTPLSGTLTNATGLPIAGITGLGTGVPALLAGASTGAGAPVGGTAPTISGPTFSGTILGTYTLGGTPTYTNLPSATNAALGVMRGDGTTISCTAGACTALGASATSIDASGATSISSGFSGGCAYDVGGKFSLSMCDHPASNFNGSGSTASTTGTITSGTATLSLGSAIDFQGTNGAGLGQGIVVAGAGASPTIGSATAFTATAAGTTGSTSYTYYVEEIDALGGIKAAVSATFANGAATLSSASSAALAWTSGAGGVVAHAIYVKCTGCTNYTTTPQLIAFIGTTSFTDQGSAIIIPPAGLSPTFITSDQGQWLVTTIASGAGSTTLTLANNASNTISAPGYNNVFHDDTTAIQNAINAAQADHSRVHLVGTTGRQFRTSATLTISSFIDLYGDGTQQTSNLGLGSFRNALLSDFGNSTLVLPRFNVSAISKTTNDAANAHHFGISYFPPAIAGSGTTAYAFQGANAIGCERDAVHDLMIAQADIGISTFNCNGFHIKDNNIYNFGTDAIRVGRGTGNNDWWIEHNNLTNGPNSVTNSSFVVLTGSAAPHVVDNKMNAANSVISGSFGILLAPSINGSSIEPVFLQRNSIEGKVTGIGFFNSCSGSTTGAISTTGTLVGGSGGVAGVYTNVLFTGGTGQEAYGTIIVGASGAVSAVNLYYGGFGYVVGDTLSATVAGITGLSFKVATIGSACGITQGNVSLNQIWAVTDISFSDGQASNFVNDFTFSANTLNTVGAASGVNNVVLGASSVTNAVFTGNAIGNSSGLGSTAWSNGGSNSNVKWFSNNANSGSNQVLGSGTSAPGSFSSCNTPSTVTNTTFNTVELHLYGGTNIAAILHNGQTIWGGSALAVLSPTTIVLQPSDSATVQTTSGTCPNALWQAINP